MMFIDFQTLVRARSQQITREVEALQRRAGLPASRPGWITRSLVRMSGKLGTGLVAVGRRLEGYARQAARRPGLNSVLESGEWRS